MNTDKKDFKGFLTMLLSRIGVHPRLSVATFLTYETLSKKKRSLRALGVLCGSFPDFEKAIHLA